MSTAEERMDEAREQQHMESIDWNRSHESHDERRDDDCPICQAEFDAAAAYYRPSRAERQAQAFVTVTDKYGWITSIEDLA